MRAGTDRIPAARGFPLIGSLPAMARDPFGFCMRAAAEGDGIVRIDVGPARAYLVSDPDYVRHISVVNANNYIKGSMMDGIRLALGDGLFTSNGDAWIRQRRLMQQAFHTRQIEQMALLIDAVLGDRVERWAPSIDRGEPIDVLAEATHINIQIVLRSLFGAVTGPEQSARLLGLTNGVFSGMAKRVWAFFLPTWMPVPGGAAYRRAISELDEEIYSLIRQRRDGGADHDDLLGIFLRSRDEAGEGMTDRQIRDEIFTVFLAGYESTASGMAWACYLLTQHPEVAGRLREEIDEVLGGRPPTFGDLRQLTYTRSVMDETFRLYPAFPMYFRSSVGPDRIGPYRLAGDAQIVISPYATHRDQRFWDDPETFDPDRFTPDRFDQRARRSYYPFGMGKRICIGEQMALTVAQMFLATLFQTYTVALAPGAVVQPRFAMTYQPRNGMPVVLTPRENRAGGAERCDAVRV